MNTKTKFRLKQSINYNTKLIKSKSVGYIDGYATKDDVVYACIVIGNDVIPILTSYLEIIDEKTFLEEDQNTMVRVK